MDHAHWNLRIPTRMPRGRQERRAYHVRHHGKPTDGAAAAFDRVPALRYADLAKCRACHPRTDFSDIQQPPKVLIAAIERLAPDPLRNAFSHTRFLVLVPVCEWRRRVNGHANRSWNADSDITRLRFTGTLGGTWPF
jgi:hypothetical protein